MLETAQPSLSLWHGTSKAVPPVVLAAADHGDWWNVIDHGTFLDPIFDEADADHRSELDFELRTAYGNLVYETLRHSEVPSQRSLAERFGLEGLGSQVGILFVTSDRSYAERYFGPAIEIDPDSESIIAMIPDDNVIQSECWLLVLKVGSPLPWKQAPEDERSYGPVPGA